MQTKTTNWKRNTAAFLSSQAISLFGSALVQYAIMWHITLSTKSGVMSMLSVICGFLPVFFLSPFAGVWADRYNRKKLIMLADGGIALATGVLAILWMSGVTEVWLLLATMAVRALGSAVQQPCVNAMLPDIVPAEQLTRVNGISGSLQSLIGLLSPIISGALMGFLPMHGIFLIDVATAALAILVMLFAFKLPVLAPKARPEKGAQLAEMKQGFNYIRKSSYLRSFFGFCVLIWLMIGPLTNLTPLQVARSYGDDVWRLSTMEVVFAVGMLLGGLLISAWGGLKNRIRTIALAGGVIGLGTFALGTPVPFWLYIGLMGFIGLCLPTLNTPAIVLLQEQVDPDYMGRVFSMMSMLQSSIMPLGLLVFGPLADTMPIEYLLMFTGAVMVVLALAMNRNPTLLKAGAARQPEGADPAPGSNKPASPAMSAAGSCHSRQITDPGELTMLRARSEAAMRR
ncbi:MFS transporter [Ruminococcaceae bacterium OttesenSCG-928-D13]|nr:MFS transporter [Ruminococcaceae bacterium OttesenSCG-928-D13]